MGTLKIITLKLLVDEAELAAHGRTVDSYITALVASAGQTENGTAIIDHSVESEEIACTELEDSVVNDTYAPGDFARNWLAAADDKRGDNRYWSYRYGLGSKDLATRFAPIERYRPHEATTMFIDQ
jgi:hypothetical protein